MGEERETFLDKMMTWGPAAAAVLAVAVVVGLVLFFVFQLTGEEEPDIIFEGIVSLVSR